jgi:hypothetical protein
MQKRKVLLDSANIGVVFVGLWLWGLVAIIKVDSFSMGDVSMGDFSIQRLKEFFANIGGLDLDTKLYLCLFFYGFFALPVLLITAAVFNFIAWVKGERKKCLVAGILYAVSLNFPSSVLCFVEYADMANPIKKKPMLISVFFGFLAALSLLLFAIFIVDSRSVFTALFIISLAAVIINFFAWKTEKGTLALLAAITYTAGILPIVSMVICYINYAKAKNIKNKSLFTSLPLGFLAALFWLLVLLSIQPVNPDDGGSRVTLIVFLIITLVGTALNYFAWLKLKKALILASAIVYTLGVFSIVSAIICYVNLAIYAKKRKKNEELN